MLRPGSHTRDSAAVAWARRQVELLDNRADDGVGLEQFHLRQQELVVIRGRARGVLAHYARRRLAVDADGDGGFVNRGDAFGEDVDADRGGEHQRRDLPQVPPQYPEIMRERDGGAFALRLRL